MNFEKAIRGLVVFREILKVVNDNVLILRNPSTDSARQANIFSSYLIGKYADVKGEINKLRTQRKRNSYKDPNLNHVNTGNNLSFLFHKLLLDVHKSIALVHKVRDVNETLLVCTQNQKFVDPESWLLTFTLELEYTFELSFASSITILELKTLIFWFILEKRNAVLKELKFTFIKWKRLL